jgi:hypothetical protein
MQVRHQRVYLAWFALHFLLIVTVCCRETFWLIARGLTILPSSLNSAAAYAEKVASISSGQSRTVPMPLREAIFGYEHLAGIEAGYGFFAPNVTDSYRLVFELRYPDGYIEYDVPSLGSEATAFRFTSLLDTIGRITDEDVRELLIRILTYANWREHPNARSVRAIFQAVELPSMDEFERGLREHYELLYAYEYTRRK